MKNNRKPQHIVAAERYEYAAIGSLKQVFERDTTSEKEIMAAIAKFTENLCYAMYSRKIKSRVKQGSVRHIVDILFVEKAIGNDVKNLVEEMCTLGSPEYSGTEFFNRNRTESYLSKCFIVIDWYEKYARKKLRGMNFKKYRELLSGTPEMTLNALRQSGAISEEAFKQSLEDSKIMDFEPEKKVEFVGKPIYMSLLIDASGSMLSAERDVIAAHELALQRLRNSPFTRNNQLYLSQYLFNHKSTTLNVLTPLDEHGNDRVTALNLVNYSPMSTTALFDSLYEAISKIYIEVNSIKRIGKHPSVMICVMTDGADTESYKYKPEDINKLMQKLKDDDLHHSSTLIGWMNSQLSEEQLNKLGESLGFSSVIPLKGINKEAISDAFEIWSTI